MPRFEVTVDVKYRKKIKVFANNETEAEERAAAICRDWDGVSDVDIIDSERQ